MYCKLITTMVLAGFTIMPLTAHDPKLHKGKATNGEVLSVTNDRVQIKTPQGITTVLVTEKTKFERGNKAVALADVKKGEPVSVIGTTLATGEISAREILLKPAQSQKSPAPGQEAAHKH